MEKPEREKNDQPSVCPVCGEVQDEYDFSIDWTCPNGCGFGD